MLQDLRFSIRALLRAKGFAAAAVLTLGVGIGAITLVYSVVDAMLLRPLPLGPAASRLVTIHSVHPTQTAPGQMDDAGVSYADLADFRASTRALEAVEAVALRNVSLVSDAESERVAAASVTPGLFTMMGARPALGRTFEPDDAAVPGFEQTAIIGDGLWQRLYARDPAVVGKPILMNGRAVTVVGVMPPAFDFPDRRQIWLPYRDVSGANRDRRGLLGVGLVREGVSVAQARDDLNATASRLADAYPDTNRAWAVNLQPMRALFVTGATRLAMTSMLAAVGLVLLVACANIAGLLVARGMGRRRELAVRAGLGAGRGSLIRLLLVESSVLALAGGAVGLLIAAWGLRAFLSWTPEPPPAWATPAIDLRVLVFACVASGVSAVAAGLLPAWKLSNATLSTGARAVGAGRDQRRLQSLLVVAQIAVSLTLVMGATLLSLSVTRLSRADAGFDPSPVASLRFYIAGDTYDDPVQRAQAVASIVDRIAALPGVVAAAATGAVPADDGGALVRVESGRAADASEDLGAMIVPVTPGFWETLGLELTEGRGFTVTEAVDPDASAVIIGRRLAQRLWSGQEATGRSIRVVEPARATDYRVVGVAPDLVFEELGEETAQSQLVIYAPYARLGNRTMALLARTEGDPGRVLQAARAEVRKVDPAFAAFDMLTMTSRRDLTQWAERFIGRIFGVFAVLGLLLACLGAYGLTAYAAARRAREIGVRIAIGATRGDIVRLLLGGGVRLALAGALIGLPIAALAAAGMSDLLFEVSPWTPGPWVAVPLALIAVVLIANYLPARKASAADPAQALRAD